MIKMVDEKIKQNFKEINNELLEKYAKTKDEETMYELIKINGAIINSSIKKFLWSNVEYEDLYQIGCVGMIKAIKSFDISKGFDFSTYAFPMVYGTIQTFVNIDKPIHIPRAIRDKLNKMHSTYYKLSDKLEEDNISKEKIAKEMNISLDDLQKLIKISCNVNLEYLDDVFYTSNGEEISKIDTIKDNSNDIDGLIDRLYIEKLISILKEKEKKIIRLKFYDNKTQKEIAKIMKISQSYVARLEKKALDKMREYGYKYEIS